MPKTHDLREQYLHLTPAERAVRLPAEGFWGQLMSGAPDNPDIAAVAAGGWLVTRFTHDGPWPHWERHPSGDEVIIALSGSMIFVIEAADGEPETVTLAAPRHIVIPAGRWHRGLEGEAELIALTAGRGTDHRPA